MELSEGVNLLSCSKEEGSKEGRETSTFSREPERVKSWQGCRISKVSFSFPFSFLLRCLVIELGRITELIRDAEH